MNSILSKRRILLNTLLVLIIIWLLNTIKQEHEHFKPRETTVTKEAQTLLWIIVLDQVDFNNVKIIYDTWASNCNNHVFISNALSEDREHFSSYNLNVVKPRKLTNFASIQSTSNTFATFEEVFLKYNNYDWYLKVHEDTFIFVDNLRQFIASKSAFMPLTYGYKKGGHLVSSAAGYVLSRKALQRLGTHLVKSFSSNQCRNTAHEDADLTQCLEALGIAAEASVDDKGLQRFYPYSLNTLKYYFPKYRIQKVNENHTVACLLSIPFHFFTVEIQDVPVFWQNKLTFKPIEDSTLLFLVSYWL